MQNINYPYQVASVKQEKNGEKKTLEEIGSYYGVSRERIRQIENRAMSKLKKLCRNNNVNKSLKNYI